MKIGVLGTGVVGRTIATRLTDLGHDVALGSRTATNPDATAWAEGTGGRAGTFADAAAHGELLVNATSGSASIAALTAAGAERLAGKVLLDVANPLDFSAGMPPTLSVANTDSLAERIQAAFPAARVVKTLNTMAAALMVRPDRIAADHVVFVAGDDETARAAAKDLLGSFGWAPHTIIDLGGLRAARGTEMYLPLWLSLYGALGTGEFNISVVRA